MKLVIQEYLAALRERDELDAILPNLLSEMGFIVYSRPSRGTRQHGVDVAAVGRDTNGEQKVYLFSVKQGDLGRADWDGTPQALRASLNEIRDVYVRTSIPSEYRRLNIVICLVFGGYVKEAVRQEVEGYITDNTTSRVTYEQWNGDVLADLILRGILREELFPDPMRSHLRKAVAMVEEPDIAYSHFRSLVDGIIDRPARTQAQRITKVGEINICLWILFTWAREAGNVEAPYRASEYAILRAWDLLKDFLCTSTKAATDAGIAFNELVDLHFKVWNVFAERIAPNVAKRHAISVAVGSSSSLDINLKVHDLLGRLAMRGLWLAWSNSEGNLPAVLTAEQAELDTLALQLFHLIDNNPALQSPICDENAIDINLALMLLAAHGRYQPAIASWVQALIRRTSYAFVSHSAYPSCKCSYWDLVGHPAEKTDEYRQEATAGSILYPMLALWALGYDNQEALTELAKFKADHLQHCNFQLWFPNEDSEAHLYRGTDRHGDALSGIPVDAAGAEALEYVQAECAANPFFDQLSAVRLGHWPIVLMACRHYRLPIPPQLWLGLLPNRLDPAAGLERETDLRGGPGKCIEAEKDGARSGHGEPAPPQRSRRREEQG
ncbi:MAG TPA: hypothetical protein VFW19_01005 [Allosphingosinicella sp.]|nr:hypothetical protein [Allosphingosinicella sp.]